MKFCSTPSLMMSTSRLTKPSLSNGSAAASWLGQWSATEHRRVIERRRTGVVLAGDQQGEAVAAAPCVLHAVVGVGVRRPLRHEAIVGCVRAQVRELVLDSGDLTEDGIDHGLLI